MKSIIKHTALLLPLCAAISATAGPVISKEVVVEDPINYLVEEAGFTLSSGYDSNLYFRGLYFSSNNVFSSLTYDMPLTEKLSLSVGALYTVSLGTDIPGAGDLKYSELDLFGGITYDAGFAALTLAYTNYTFFDTFSGSIDGQTFGFPESPDSTITGASDVALTLAVPVGGGSVYGTYVYDLRIAAHYFEAGADYTIPVTPWMSLVPAVAVGYGMDYYSYREVTGQGSGWNHVGVRLSAPIQLTPSAAFIPYVAGNFSLENREQINTVQGANDIFGGASVSVSF